MFKFHDTAGLLTPDNFGLFDPSFGQVDPDAGILDDDVQVSGGASGGSSSAEVSTASLTPATLGLSDISFSQVGPDAAAAGSNLSSSIAARLGGGSLSVNSLRLLLPAATAAPAPAGALYSAIYAFGDSLSDTGNDFTATAGQLPSSPYFAGHFSNGSIWVQDLATQLGLQPPGPSLLGGTDFAYGGAETGTTALHAATPLDLPSQLMQFEAQVPHPDPNALYTVWIGSNDVLDAASAGVSNPGAAQQAVDQAVANEDNFLSQLVGLGAKHLLVLDVPDLSLTPYELDAGESQATLAGGLADRYDAELFQDVTALQQSSGATIDLMDTFGLLDSAIVKPFTYGFTDVRDPVWSGGLTSDSGGTLRVTGAAEPVAVLRRLAPDGGGPGIHRQRRGGCAWGGRLGEGRCPSTRKGTKSP